MSAYTFITPENLARFKSNADLSYAKTADLGALATKDIVAESDLAAALQEKVNAAAEGNHAHSNKAVLDDITATKVSSWDSKAAGDHSHAYADLTGKPTIPTTVAELTDAGNYAKVADLPTFTAATEAQIDAMFQ